MTRLDELKSQIEELKVNENEYQEKVSFYENKMGEYLKKRNQCKRAIKELYAEMSTLALANLPKTEVIDDTNEYDNLI